MGATWKEIVPNDRFCVRVVRPISMAEMRYLTHLYQPLIGPMAISLYQTLYAELPSDSFASRMGTHRWLMSIFMMPLDQILDARHKLEALGLVRTSRIEKESGDRLFEYNLIPPLTPYQFFQHDILNVMLLNRVGQNRYLQLRQMFGAGDTAADREINDAKPGREITKSFDEVFDFLTPSELKITKGSESDQFLRSVTETAPLPELAATDESGPVLRHTELDFDYLQAVLPKWAQINLLEDEQIQSMIKEVSFLYGMDQEIIGRILQEPSIYDERDQLDPEPFKKMVRLWYRDQTGVSRPVLTEKKANRTGNHPVPAPLKTEPASETDMYRAHIRRLESTPPLKLLQEYQGGGKVSAADQKIVEELLEDYLLPPGVVNVLLEYVMFTHDRQLPRALIFKIAAHWKRVGIRTVVEAQKQAKDLYKKYIENSGPKKKQATAGRRTRPYTQPKREEKLPEWVKEQLEQENKQSHNREPEDNRNETSEDPALNEKKKRIAELLKELRK
ncbi:MAG: DnaD domain protein [Bacillaceae bacterium]|nr:DnaD domain protein [Bacillaceae bacterium]